MQWPFKVTTPSQSEIFSVKAVIVDYLYAVAFQGDNTLSLWEGAVVLKGHCTQPSYNSSFQKKIFHFGRVLLS